MAKNLLRNISLTLASLLLFLLVGELTFRLFISVGLVKYPNPDYQKICHVYSRDKRLVYEMKPSFSGYESGILIKTNKFGMRDYDYALEKPKGVKRICILGDSVAFGFKLPFEKTFAKLLENRLNANSTKKYDVLNFSVAGYNSYQEEILLKEKVLQFSPDILLVSVCLNDDTFTDGFGDLIREGAPYSIGARLHSKLITNIFNECQKKFFYKLSNISKVEHLIKELTYLSRKHNFGTYILIFPYYDECTKKYSLYSELSHKYGLDTVDFMFIWKRFDKEERKSLYLPEDNDHLSARGMNEVSDVLFDIILKKKDTNNI